MAKSMAMKKVKKALAKSMAMKNVKKAMKVKVKVQHVQKAEDEAKATAAAKKNTKAKGNAAAATKKKALAKAAAEAKKSAMKKPAASWNAWAEEEDDDDDGEEEEEEVLEDKDYEVPSKAQAKVFDEALKRTPGTRGSLPAEIHEVWNNIQRGPGAAKERHALRNAIVPKDAGYGHICTIDPNGPLMTRIKEVFEVKQKKTQMKGLTESEALWTSFHGNEDAMQKAIAKKDLKEMNGMYYWHRDIHEHITGGKDQIKFGGGEPRAMTLEDKEKMMELLDDAPWAKWGTTNIPVAELKHVVKANSDAMHRAQECLDASKAVCIAVQNFFKQIQKEGILTSPEAGSIPSIMKTAVKAANEMEKDHMQPMAALIYDTDGTNKATVKDVKEMLNSAAKALTPLSQHLQEAKALVQKFKNKEKKELASD
jgi:hypothetical protein